MAGDRGRSPLGVRLARRVPLVLAISAVAFVWIGLNLAGIYFRDALAYWRPDLADLYGGREVGVASTYLYSPAFAQLVTPLGLLPWPAFAALWSALNLGVMIWMIGPYLAALLLIFPGPVADEISTGNIHLLLAAAVVIGFRQPAAWAFPLLTKVTPGIGILWFVGGRRWRLLAIGLGTTLAIVTLSFALAPSAWFEWIETLRRSSEVSVSGQIAVIPGPLWLRTALAAIIVLVAGWRGIAWLVPVAVTIALPVPWSSGLALLVGSIALSRGWWEPAVGRAWRRITSAT
ncbi:MAG: glycosyltransferase family 87 protein [Candidatus Limnocylindria bacterium]